MKYTKDEEPREIIVLFERTGANQNVNQELLDPIKVKNEKVRRRVSTKSPKRSNKV